MSKKTDRRDAAALRKQSEQLAVRLVSCLPAATFEMETLVQLTGVEASHEIETAAVTCEDRPRLLFNPDFVAEHCASDEHLFLLAMHELWHVLLAHTRLYPRATAAENIAFDAVINAGLAQQFPAREYRGFFERLNPHNSFPGLLLRPPPGWPDRSRRSCPGPSGTADIVRRLYPRASDEEVAMPLYSEILDLLHQAPDALGGSPAAGSLDGEGADAADVTLLGDHGDPNRDTEAINDPLFGDVVRRIVASWPPPPFPLEGRDVGGLEGEWLAAMQSPRRDAQRAFARVLRRVLGATPLRAQHRTRAWVPSSVGLGPLPNPADRTRHARRALGLPALLQQQVQLVPARVFDERGVAHVYVDVSGSMFEILPWITGLLAPWVAAGRARCFQFSTGVWPLGGDALNEGRLQTTGGTSIDCVLEHWLACRRVRRALVLTDGYVGPPRNDLAQALSDRRLRLHAVLPAENGWRRDLEPIAESITHLPPLADASRGRASA